jgi:hypothetical protein
MHKNIYLEHCKKEKWGAHSYMWSIIKMDVNGTVTRIWSVFNWICMGFNGGFASRLELEPV